MRTFFIVVMMILSMNAVSQSSKNINRAPQNFLTALASHNDGVVASAIFTIVKYKKAFPEKDTAALETALMRISTDHSSSSIRYKAYLALQFCRNGSLLAKIEKRSYKDAEAFFRMLSMTIDREYLVSQ